MTAVPCSVVLVVDDDPSIFPLLEAVLSSEAVHLEGASDGPGALQAVDGGLAPDLVLLDVMMPGMNGLEVLRRLKERPGFDQVPVILLTARSQTEDVVRGLEGGASDYVTKPFDLAELRARVRAALRLREVFRQLELARAAHLERERLKVLMETAGTVAHTVNQPLTAGLLRIETLLRHQAIGPELRKELEKIQSHMEKVALAVTRIRDLTTYRTTEYLEGVAIVDLEAEE
ncbi:MAG: hypothetical protein Kow0092_09730 [Deferrisomatales bacterium]